jgi:hypothetical protein
MIVTALAPCLWLVEMIRLALSISLDTLGRLTELIETSEFG